LIEEGDRMAETLKNDKGTVKELVSLLSEHTLNAICGKPRAVLYLRIAHFTLITKDNTNYFSHGITISSDELNTDNLRDEFLPTFRSFNNLFYFNLISFILIFCYTYRDCHGYLYTRSWRVSTKISTSGV